MNHSTTITSLPDWLSIQDGLSGLHSRRLTGCLFRMSLQDVIQDVRQDVLEKPEISSPEVLKKENWVISVGVIDRLIDLKSAARGGKQVREETIRDKRGTE